MSNPQYPILPCQRLQVISSEKRQTRKTAGRSAENRFTEAHIPAIAPPMTAGTRHIAVSRRRHRV
jgi:hypothetical protein